MQISLGRAPGIAYTTFLIVFTAVALLGTTTLRVKANLGELQMNWFCLWRAGLLGEDMDLGGGCGSQ